MYLALYSKLKYWMLEISQGKVNKQAFPKNKIF